MKSDSEKLNDVMDLLRSYKEAVDEAVERDGEVNFGGNGINCSEAEAVIRPLYQEALEIISS